MPRWLLAAFVLALSTTVLVAVPPTTESKAPDLLPAEAQAAADRVQVEGGLKATLWASEPQVLNPVTFAFDPTGVCYVVETRRFGNGVPDTRGFMQWLEEDIGSRSVADRLAMYKKHNYKGFEEFDDQIRVLRDTNQSGQADQSHVFAKGFNQLESGLAAGILVRNGAVYLTNIPSLFRLKDTTNDGKADERTVLSTGYGNRVQFIGHDLHGLRMGPDGKLYFSIGDRGLSVRLPDGGKLENLDSGCVLRCDLDGQNLEIVHTGLRNPQELAFDELGNLFTYDNNSDSGDQARWVQIVEGGDSGWRCGFQYGTLMHHDGVPQGNRGPWNTEGIWHLATDPLPPPAYVVPALKHFGNGPAGLTYYPGLGLSDRYQNHFFACDFTASPSNSLIWSLECKPAGASFEVTDLHPFTRTVVPTDCEFGPDGAFYVLDWVGGWVTPEKGRVFRITDPKAMANPAVAEAQKLFAEGFTKRSVPELVKLLEHPHREVRQEAQFELAGRPAAEAVPALEAVAQSQATSRTRLHAIWGLGMAAVQAHAKAPELSQRAIQTLIGLSANADALVRKASVVTLSRHAPSFAPKPGADGAHAEPIVSPTVLALRERLTDTDPAVQAAAASAYGRAISRKIGSPFPQETSWYLTPLLDVLAANTTNEPYLRQAAVDGLVRAAHSGSDVVTGWKQSGPKYNTATVRMGIVLALRRLEAVELRDFLTDAEPAIGTEAARAIYDQVVVDALPALAELGMTSTTPDPVKYRVLGANFHLGTPNAAARVAATAARPDESVPVREFALKLLSRWATPGRLDPITGLRLDLPGRSADVPRAAVTPLLASLFSGPDSIRREAATTCAKLGVTEVGPFMQALVLDERQPANTRTEALYALAALKSPELAKMTEAALADSDARLRAAGRVVAAQTDPEAALQSLPALLADDSTAIPEKQAALTAMATLPESEAVDQALATTLDAAIDGKLPFELKLETMEAAAARVRADKLTLHAPLKDKLTALDKADRARADTTDPLARMRESFAGGDADRGRQIFLNNAAVYCQRCHKLDGQGGEVGPPMNGIAQKHPREYLFESIVRPNAKIAEGYQSLILTTVDGKTISGVLRAKDDTKVTLVTPENEILEVPTDDIESERPDQSAMPADLHKKLTPRELRDLVEFLTSLTGPLPAK